MGDHFWGKVRSRASATAADTNGGGVTATIAAPTAPRHYTATGIQTSSDAACVVTIESPAATILWQKRYAAAHAASEEFPIGMIVGAAGEALLVKTSAGTTNSEANIQGALV